jgi:hypothetical protein
MDLIGIAAFITSFALLLAAYSLYLSVKPRIKIAIGKQDEPSYFSVEANSLKEVQIITESDSVRELRQRAAQ